MGRLKRKIVSVLMCAVLLAALFAVGKQNAVNTEGNAVRGEKRICVVLDAGHGGDDPGKIGIGGVLEKDINLEIVMLLKKYLEAEGIEVILTREDENGLYDADSSNKKVQDMKKRIEIIENVSPDVTVSIHQNSYPEEYVHGAQVFYYDTSVEGKKLADSIQSQIVDKADGENKRQIKGNQSYYLLKKTDVPIVIVECGFLSNNEETKKLCEEEYRQRMAWAIHMGILRYLNAKNA